MAESGAPQWELPLPSIEPAPERGIPSGRAILNLGLMNGGCWPRWGRFVPWLGLLQPRMDKRRCWLGDIFYGQTDEVYASWALSWGRTGVR